MSTPTTSAATTRSRCCPLTRPLARAGYPAHILHERIVRRSLLKRYKTLVVVGQTFELPEDVKKVIDDWSAKGGTVIVDETTKAKFAKAIVTKADFRDPAFRWGAYFGLAEKKDHPFKSNREASVYHTNWFMDEQVRKAVKPLRETMKKTRVAAGHCDGFGASRRGEAHRREGWRCTW